MKMAVGLTPVRGVIAAVGAVMAALVAGNVSAADNGEFPDEPTPMRIAYTLTGMHVDSSDDVYDRPSPTSRPLARRTLKGTITGPPGGEIRVKGTVSVKGGVPAIVNISLQATEAEGTRFGLNPRDDGTASSTFDVPARLWSDGTAQYVQLLIRVQAVGDSPLDSATIVGSFLYQPSVGEEVTVTPTPTPTPPPEKPGFGVSAIPGYDIPWAISERIALRLIFTSTSGERWKIQQVCDLAEDTGGGYETYYLPRVPGTCIEVGGQTSATLDIPLMMVSQVRNIESPRAIPMQARIRAQSNTGERVEVSQQFNVELKGAYKVFVKRQGVGLDGLPSQVTLDGGLLSTGLHYLGFWGQTLESPYESVVGVRFVDGSAGFIVVPKLMDIAFDDIILAHSADEGGFIEVAEASVGSLAQELGGNMAEDAIMDVLLGRLSGALGAFDFGVAVPAGRGAARILAR